MFKSKLYAYNGSKLDIYLLLYNKLPKKKKTVVKTVVTTYYLLISMA